MDGVTHKVTQNAGSHHIHGGRKGFARVVWQVEPLPLSDTSAAVRWHYHAKDGEEGEEDEESVVMDDDVRGCERECNDQFMSLKPVDDEWIGENVTLASFSC